MADKVVAFHVVCSGAKFTFEVPAWLSPDLRMKALVEAQDKAFESFYNAVDAEASFIPGMCDRPHTLWMESTSRSVVLDSSREGWYGNYPLAIEFA